MPPTSQARWKNNKAIAVFELQTIVVFSLVTLAMGGIVWVFIYPHLSGERHAEKRLASIAKSEPITRTSTARIGQKNRREQVEETLKELDDRQKKYKKQSLSTKLSQAGLDWSRERYLIT